MPGGRRRPLTHLGRPVLGTRAQVYARIRTRLVAVQRMQTRRLRVTHVRLGRPVGRAVALTVAYPVRVVRAVMRSVRLDRRRVRSLRLRIFGSTPVVQAPARHILALLAKRRPGRLRIRATRLRVFGTPAPVRPARVRLAIPRPGRRRLRSLRLRPLGGVPVVVVTNPRPIQTHRVRRPDPRRHQRTVQVHVFGAPAVVPPASPGWSDSAPRRRHTPMAWYRWAWWVLASYPGGDASS